MPIVCSPGAVLKQANTGSRGTKAQESGCRELTLAERKTNVAKQKNFSGRKWKETVWQEEGRQWQKRDRQTVVLVGGVEMGRRGMRGTGRNSADSLAVPGQAQQISPVTRDQGRHVSSQIAPQAHWQELSAEKGERLLLACSHARVNHKQLQRGGAIKRPWWSSTECVAYSAWVS